MDKQENSVSSEAGVPVTVGSGALAGDVESAFETLIQLTLGVQIEQASLRAALELGVPDQLGKRALSSDHLARELKCDPDSLDRLLRGLTTSGLLVELPKSTFALTPLGRRFRSDVPDSLRDFALFILHPYRFRALEQLADSVREGVAAFDRTYGMGVFDYQGKHPELQAIFQRGMTSATLTTAREFAQTYPFDGIEVVADVGGGQGELLFRILEANPKIRGVLYDLPSVVEGARHRLSEAGLTNRCQIVGGSFFDSVPTGADIYVLKSIIHDWQDEKAVSILRRTREAMHPKARLLLVELVLPDEPGPSVMFLADINMLAFTGGRERSRSEFERLLAQANLRLSRIVRMPGITSIVEAIPS